MCPLFSVGMNTLNNTDNDIMWFSYIITLDVSIFLNLYEILSTFWLKALLAFPALG